jgi:Xaa-Pro aminopeptidase
MDRFLARRDKLRATLERDGRELHVLLVSSPTNVSYLTGFTGDSSVLVLSRSRDIVISDGRFTTQFEQECPGLECQIRAPGQEMNPAIARVLKSLGQTQVGIEATSMTVAEYEGIRAAAATSSFFPVAGWVEALREIKDDDEIAAIREAVLVAERAYTSLCAEIRLD